MALVVALLGTVLSVAALATDVPELKPQFGAESDLRPADVPGSSEQGLASLAEAGERAVRAADEARQARRSPEAVVERAKSRELHAEASPDDVEALLAGDFTDLLNAGKADTASLLDGAGQATFLDDRTLLVDLEGAGGKGLVESTLPLRAESDTGEEAPVDLDLEPVSGGFEAANPLVEVSFPSKLAVGATVGRLRVLPETAGEEPTDARVLDKIGGLLYHETTVDTDLILAPVPTGAEVAWLLRSPRAPESQRLSFDLPDGGELLKAPDGGVDLVAGDERLGRVLPPYAVDAQGQDVDVSYSIDGGALVVEVPHRDDDVAYPVLVDPVVEDWLGSTSSNSWFHGHNYDGLSHWNWASNQVAYGQPYAPRTDCYAPVSCYAPAGMPVPPYGRGLYAYVFHSPYVVPANTFGEWVYDPPGTTTQVTSAVLGPNFLQRRTAGQNPYFFLGIWANGIANWTALATYPTIDLANYFTTLTAGTYYANSGGNAIAVGFFSPTTVTLSAWRDFAVGGARITLTDPENPTVASLGLSGPGDWVSSGTFEVAPTGTDPGLGVKSLKLSVPRQGGTSVQTRTHGCTGRRANPCPGSWTLPSGAATAFSFTTADADPATAGNQQLAEGITTVRVETTDILGKVSPASTATVKVDRGEPLLSLDGSLWDERESSPPPRPGVPIAEGVYELAVEADDPAEGSAPLGTRSGVERIEVEVDGQSAAVEEEPCTAGNCSLTLDWDFETSEYGPGRHTIEVFATDGAGNVSSEELTVFVPVHPPDAPPLQEAGVTPIGEATEFLYAGPDPLQTGVAPGTIEPVRAAVIRGVVTDVAGDPLPGVQVTVPDHPELGSTVTRGDGEFYLAVNGGGPLTVRFEEEDYLSVDRRVDVPWQDYVWADDVVMTELDPNATVVDLSSPLSPVQVARGSVETDADGTRQATLIFPTDTSAEMIMPNGTPVPLDELTVRATEYTVGESGPDAMPGELPATSAYTYAAEYSVDEALAAGAAEVRFSKPVINYTENFVGFDTGTIVPTGYYDRAAERWVPAPNGRVIEILSESAGVATLDVTGSGNPATPTELTELGVTTEEREELADLYGPGDTLWRVPMDHFTPWDHNWPWGPPADAVSPSGMLAPADVDESCTSEGSVIECENQVLGEDLPLSGTDIALHYRSSRVAGSTAALTADVPLTGPSPPTSLKQIELTAEVAGKSVEEVFAPAPNLRHEFEWDGKDAFGREVHGQHPATLTVTYVYNATRYQDPAEFANAFAKVSGVVGSQDARREMRVSQTLRTNLGKAPRNLELGGWTLSPHHRYDPVSGVLHGGDGTRRSAENVGSVVRHAVGGSAYGYSGDGGPAEEAGMNLPWAVAVAPDGSVYLSDSSRVRKVDAAGHITTVAGAQGFRDYGDPAGDGGPASEATFWWIGGLDVGPDGSVYITDGRRLRKIDPAGIITTIAGQEVDRGTDPLFGGDGGPAHDARFGQLEGVAVAEDGTIYVADPDNGRVRQIGTDGLATTVAGNGSTTSGGDGGPAVDAGVAQPLAVEVGEDGALYIADSVVRRVGSDGIIQTVAGDGTASLSEYGTPATSTSVMPRGIAIDLEGRLVLATGQGTVDRVDETGTLVNVGGVDCWGSGSCSTAAADDGGLAGATDIGCPADVDVAPDGSVYYADSCNLTVGRLESSLPEYGGTDISIASADGSELYRFDRRGRHLDTTDALTGATLYEFTYDPDGRLISFEDGDGLQTTIERDGSGVPVAIEAPFGQRTLLSVAAGRLEAVENPAGEAVAFDYADGHLMESMTTPEGRTTTFTYDDLGRLIKDQDPGGGFKQLVRGATGEGSVVTLATKLGRASTYSVEREADGSILRRWSDPSGLERTALIQDDGVTSVTHPDGTEQESTSGPDPRFGMEASVAAESVTETPGGRRRTAKASRSIDLSDESDVLSVESSEERIEVNGRATTTAFDAALSRFQITSPAGRLASVTVDSQRRPLSSSVSGIAATSYGRDAVGRVETITQGTQTSSIEYDALGRVESTTDALGRERGFEYDAADRVVKEILPDLREIAFDYDDDGNLTSVTPPSRPAHSLARTPLGQIGTYTPPDLGSGPQPTTFDWSDDRELTRVTKPGGRLVELDYDAGGRLEGVSHTGGETEYGYDAGTGSLATAETAESELTQFAWDGFLPLSETSSGTVAGSVSRTYDDDLQITSESVNGGHTAAFDYDDDGLLVTAGSLTLDRDVDNGLLTGGEQGLVETVIERDAFGDPERVSSTAGGTVLYEEEYERDDLGRIVEKVERRGTAATVYEYGYDLGGRLQTVVKDGLPAATYSYDANGNRVEVDRPGSLPVVAQYDDQDRLTDYGAVSYDHDASGQLESKTDGADTTSYAYDDLGALRSLTLPNGDEIDYAVDAGGRRIAKKVDGVLTQGFLYGQGLGPAVELNGAGNVVSRFVYGTRANVPDYMVRGGQTYRILTDQLGSPRAVVDVSTGVVAQQMDFDEFGRVVQDTNPGFQPFGFAGGLYDVDTGLVRFGARDYDPETGRWTAKDPIGFEGGDPNLYGYVLGDPVNGSDPTGLFLGLPSFEDISNFAAGFGDAVTSPLEAVGLPGTRSIRQGLGTDHVDYCSDAYGAGGVAGTGISAMTGGAGLGRAVGYRVNVWERYRRGGGGANVRAVGRPGDNRVLSIDRHPIPGSGRDPRWHVDMPSRGVRHWRP